MKMMSVALAVVVGFALMVCAGCATGTKKESGFLKGYYKYLQPGPEGGAKMIWMKPGVMFGKYDKFMVDSVIFFFADDSAYKGIDPNEMKELSDGFNQAIVAAFKDKYPIVTEPGPDVARIRTAITGVKESRLVSWSGSGTTSAELEMLDSITSDVILASQDERSAGFTERFSKWGSAQEAFKYWAEGIVVFIDNTRGMK